MEPLLAEGQAWLSQAIPTRGNLSQSLLESGEQLAVRLRERAVDLSYSKATEFSPSITPLHFMAAKVAFLVFGSGSPKGEVYENDASYYKSFPSAASAIAEYEEFKRSCV